MRLMSDKAYVNFAQKMLPLKNTKMLKHHLAPVIMSPDMIKYVEHFDIIFAI